MRKKIRKTANISNLPPEKLSKDMVLNLIHIPVKKGR